MKKNAIGTLHFFAGHSHAGKSTQARKLGEDLKAPVLSIDHWVSLMTQDGGVDAYLSTYPHCLKIIEELTIELLQKGIDVIFDFGGNTDADRQWINKILKMAAADHILYVVTTSAETCRTRFAKIREDAMPQEHFEMLLMRYDQPQDHHGFKIRYMASEG